MADLLRCSLCHRFEYYDPKSIVILKCQHMLHIKCIQRWALLVGPDVKCILCLKDKSKVADGPRKCPSCKITLQTKEEILHHVYMYHDVVSCVFCDFVYMRHQIDNHIDHFCQGPRCGICMKLCDEDESTDTGQYVHDECMEAWNRMSLSCVSRSNDGKMECPMYQCDTKIRSDKWDDHMSKKHSSLMIHSLNDWKCLIPECDLVFDDMTTFKEHFQKLHSSMTCDICGDEFLVHLKKKHMTDICPYKIVHCPVFGCKHLVNQPLRVEILRNGGEKNCFFEFFSCLFRGCIEIGR